MNENKLKPDGGTYHMPAPMGRTAFVKFDLVSQQMLVCCRRNADGSCVLEVSGSGSIKIVPLSPDTVYIEPIKSNYD